MPKIKHTFDVVIAVEKSPAQVAELQNACALLGVDAPDHIVAPNGRSFAILGEMRASTVVDSEVSNDEAERKAVRTACFFFKQNNPEWADDRLHGLDPELVKRSLVR